ALREAGHHLPRAGGGGQAGGRAVAPHDLDAVLSGIALKIGATEIPTGTDERTKQRAARRMKVYRHLTEAITMVVGNGFGWNNLHVPIVMVENPQSAIDVSVANRWCG